MGFMERVNANLWGGGFYREIDYIEDHFLALYYSLYMSS